jgi:hypothetical protein
LVSWNSSQRSSNKAGDWILMICFLDLFSEQIYI